MDEAAVASYTVLLRAHVWDAEIAEMANNTRKFCRGGDFFVAADETNGPLAVQPFHKISHTEDFSHLSLPQHPKGRVLWWNADYVLFAAMRDLPGYDYYVMIEYDTFVTCDVESIIATCAAEKIDFVAHAIKPIAEDHWSRASVSDMPEPHWWALLPFLVLSARALDVLLRARQSMAAELHAGRLRRWPYCEPFIPTVIKHHPELGTATLDMFADVSLLRFRPFVSVRDPRLNQPGLVAHPVLSGKRYIAAALSRLPAGVQANHAGQLRPEFRYEKMEDLADVFSEPSAETAALPPPSQLPARQDIPQAPGTPLDLALNRPARLSSRYKWSKGTGADDDAARAVASLMPDDYAFHTAGEFEPWWCVDLEDECLVGRVDIVNRRHHARRFTRFRIECSMDAVTWTRVFEKSDDIPVSSDPISPCTCILQRDAVARYVRIVLAGTNVLHLRAVRVFGMRKESVLF